MSFRQPQLFIITLNTDPDNPHKPIQCCSYFFLSVGCRWNHPNQKVTIIKKINYFYIILTLSLIFIDRSWLNVNVTSECILWKNDYRKSLVSSNLQGKGNVQDVWFLVWLYFFVLTFAKVTVRYLNEGWLVQI